MGNFFGKMEPDEPVPPEFPPTGPFSDQDGNPYYLYRLVIVGDHRSGKTSLLRRFANNEFEDDNSHIIYDLQVRTIEFDDITIKLLVFDVRTIGRYNVIPTLNRRTFYRGSVGVIIAYDTCKEETFNNVPHWVEEVKTVGRPDMKLLIVGTNCDRASDKTVDYLKVRSYANENQIPFLEVSSKDGTNIDLAFLTLVAGIRQSELERV